MMPPSDRFLAALVEGRLREAHSLLGDEMQRRLSVEDLGTIVTELKQELGALVLFSRIGAAPVGDYRAETFKILAEHGTVAVIVTTAGDGVILGLALGPRAETVFTTPAVIDSPWTLGSAGDVSSGVLTFPRHDEVRAAVVVIPGSGPHDVDGPQIGPPILRGLAHGLAARGFAVARFRKRASAPVRTVEDELILDALRATEALRGDSRVSGLSVVILGHSLGAWVAPEVAARAGGVSGLVLLSPPGRPATRVVADQLERAGAFDPALRSAVEEIERGEFPDDREFLGAPGSYWKDLAKRDPFALARSFDGPVLILRGVDDVQTTTEDACAWTERVGPKVRVVAFPQLGHALWDASANAIADDPLAEITHFLNDVGRADLREEVDE